MITDTTKAGVPNAKVTATDADRNVEYPTTADSSGRYIFPGLPPARYALTVEAPGFRKATQPAFRLEVQQQATVNIELTVGEVTTAVEVTAAAPLLNTTSATLGQVVESRFIMSTPNQGRSPLSLVALAPGITGSTGDVAFISNGVRNNASEVLMDGAALTGIEQNGGITELKYQPTTDVVEGPDELFQRRVREHGWHDHQRGFEKRHQRSPRGGLLFPPRRCAERQQLVLQQERIKASGLQAR